MWKSMFRDNTLLFIFPKLFLMIALWKISMLMLHLLKQRNILLILLLHLDMFTLSNLLLISKEAKMEINLHSFHQNTTLLMIFQSTLMGLFSRLFTQPHILSFLTLLKVRYQYQASWIWEESLTIARYFCWINFLSFLMLILHSVIRFNFSSTQMCKYSIKKNGRMLCARLISLWVWEHHTFLFSKFFPAGPRLQSWGCIWVPKTCSCIPHSWFAHSGK